MAMRSGAARTGAVAADDAVADGRETRAVGQKARSNRDWGSAGVVAVAAADGVASGGGLHRVVSQ